MTYPAGQPPAGAGGWMPTSCRTNGDRRWCGCGIVAPGSGPSGVRWLQLATVSMKPAASTLAAAAGRRGGGRNGMSWVLLSFRLRTQRRRGRGCRGAGGVGGDQRDGDHHDEQFRQAHLDKVRVVQVVGDGQD